MNPMCLLISLALFLWLSETIECDFLQTKYISLEHFGFCHLRIPPPPLFFCLHWTTCGILVPQQAIEPAFEAQSLHWTTRGVPELSAL